MLVCEHSVGFFPSAYRMRRKHGRLPHDAYSCGIPSQVLHERKKVTVERYQFPSFGLLLEQAHNAMVIVLEYPNLLHG
jgi:hypothetical protein